MVGDRGDLREKLANTHAGHARRDRGVRPAEFDGGVGLGVPRVELRRATPQPKEDHRSRRAGGRAAGGGADLQEVGHRQAEHGAGADLQEGAARQSLARPLSSLAKQQHRFPPRRNASVMVSIIQRRAERRKPPGCGSTCNPAAYAARLAGRCYRPLTSTYQSDIMQIAVRRPYQEEAAMMKERPLTLGNGWLVLV